MRPLMNKLSKVIISFFLLTLSTSAFSEQTGAKIIAFDHVTFLKGWLSYKASLENKEYSENYRQAFVNETMTGYNLILTLATQSEKIEVGEICIDKNSLLDGFDPEKYMLTVGEALELMASRDIESNGYFPMMYAANMLHGCK